MIQTSVTRKIAYGILGTVFMCALMILTRYNNFMAGALGILGGVALYFVMVLTDKQRDYLNVRAVFTAIWIVTISMGQMRFLGYQKPWLTKTWICVILAYAAFQAGAILAEYLTPRIDLGKCKRTGFMKNLRLAVSEKRLFIFCMAATGFGLMCFLGNVAIKGYIPFFSSDPNAYTNFYTRLYVFSVASTMMAGPCYYCLKTCKLQLWQKVLLWLCVVYNVLAFPVLVVSRGTFITAAISLSCAMYYLNKKKLWILITCLAVMFSVYLLCSTARNYSDAQLDDMFKPVDVVPGPTTPGGDHQGGEDAITIKLPGKVAFVYSYFTVSHDNLNEAVEHNRVYTYGLRQLRPFNVLLRSDAIDKAIDEAEYYLVQPHLNTVNLMGDAYYDFGIFGMVLMPFAWAFLFAMMQAAYLRKQNPYLQLAMNNAISVVALSFFATWMSQFSTWMHWGVALLMLLACGIQRIPHNETVQEIDTIE